jgi:hypothetical protein
MARLANPSDSPPCLWHMRLCTMLRHASAEVGAPVLIVELDVEVVVLEAMKLVLLLTIVPRQDVSPDTAAALFMVEVEELAGI